jgi:hypothetical protein
VGSCLMHPLQASRPVGRSGLRLREVRRRTAGQ